MTRLRLSRLLAGAELKPLDRQSGEDCQIKYRTPASNLSQVKNEFLGYVPNLVRDIVIQKLLVHVIF